MPVRVVSFRVTAQPGRETPLGIAPPSEGIVLKDFTSGRRPLGNFPPSRVRLDVTVGGSVIVEIPPFFEYDASGDLLFRFNTHFTAGILVRGGERVFLYFDGPLPVEIGVGGLNQGPTLWPTWS